MKVSNVIPAEIDFQDQLFNLKNSTVFELKRKEVSTFFNPVWLQAKNDKRFRIVDGFRLLSLFEHEHEPISIPARIFPVDHSISDLWLLRVQKKSTEQNLSAFGVIESLLSLTVYLKTEYPENRIISFLKCLGYPEDKLNLTNLEETVQILKKHCGFCDLYELSQREIFGLTKRKQKDLEAMTVLFQGLKLKGNKLQSMLQLLDELSKGYRLSPQALIEKPETAALLADGSLQTRYKSLKTYLTAQRWPVLDKTKKKWEHSVKKMCLPDNLDISIDPYFEADQIAFSMKAASLEEFNQLLGKLQQLSTSPEFAQLFEII